MVKSIERRMAPSRRLLAAAAVFVVVLSVLVTGSLVFETDGQSTDPTRSMVDVDIENESSTLWPYTSRATAFDERTLSINVVVYGDTDVTRRHLEEQSEGDWNETPPEEEDVGLGEDEEAVVGTTTAWGSADGSIRYTYVEPPGEDGEGRWLDESYQLHDGDYLGSRHHIRAYESPAGEDWTAMQAHSEHWDWFHFRHTVDSVETSQRYVEREFMDQWFVSNVQRTHMDNDRGSDADGWVTTVEFIDHETTLPGLLVGLVSASLLSRFGVPETRTELPPRIGRAFALSGSLVVLYLFVRFGAITLEGVLSGLDPRVIAATFYPLIFAGLPICTYHFARPLDRSTAFAAASVGFAVAILLDYTILGVMTLPVNVLVHRFSAAVALGFIAVGASRTERFGPDQNGFIRTGVVLWVVALALPLLQFV